MHFKPDWKKLIPHISAIAIFFIASIAYFPEVIEKQKISQGDNLTFEGMSKEIKDFREETGEEALWTNSMFGGMPAYLSGTKYKGNVLAKLHSLLQLGPRPVSFLFLYLLGFYILLLSFKVNPWLAIAGAFAFAFSTYNFFIITAGHNSKAICIGYMAPILAGIIYSFRGKKILGASITGVFLSLQLYSGHPQITYYTFLMIFLFGLTQLYFAFRERYFKDFLITVAILVVAVGFGVSSNAARLWTTMEYSKYSMRSPTELTTNEEDKSGGLDRSYVTAWSYSLDETFTFLIPAFKGGSSVAPLKENSEIYRLFAQGNPAQAEEVIKQLPLYWGKQSSTLGPFYAGAIMVFLFILGMFLVDKRIKWWLLAATLLSIMLAWGKNFMFLTNLFMDYFPGYNKFRTVTMAMVIADMAIPLLGILAMHKVLFGNVEEKKLNNALKWSAGIAGGIALIFGILPDLAGSFVAAGDGNYQPQFAEAIQADRRSLLRSDALRSFVFIALTTVLILAYRMKKVKLNLAILIMAVLIIADMWPVDKRYLNKNHFTSKSKASQPFTATPADQYITNSQALNDRVLNLSVSPFQDGSTSYFHHSIGGYHGAKMRSYQDIIETRLIGDMNVLITGLRTQNMDSVNMALSRTPVLNMLNTRYIVVNPQSQPVINAHASGNAWFVNQVNMVADADQDIATLARLDISNQCTLDERYADLLEKRSFTPDSSAGINMTSYQPNHLVYNSHSSSEQFAVFSEIFYDKGWIAYIDGEEAEYLRVNYLLRGMVIPEGTHEIVFEFKPRSFYAGTTISRISSVLLILVLLGALFLEYRKEDSSEKVLIEV